MKSGGQRIKGRAFEQKIARILKFIWPNTKRGIQFRFGGKEAGDIEGTPYHIECSKGSESIWAKWKQANNDAYAMAVYNETTCASPIVIKQRDREDPVVMLSFKEFIKIMSAQYLHDFPDIAEVEEQYKKEFGN